MVRELERKRQSARFPESAHAARPKINAIFISSVAVLVIPLSALGVLALSKCGALRIQVNPFELQLIKGNCSAPNLEQEMK